MRHIRLQCLQAGSKITLAPQTPNAFENRNAMRFNLRIFTRIFSAKKRPKNKNIQPPPEKQYS